MDLGYLVDALEAQHNVAIVVTLLVVSTMVLFVVSTCGMICARLWRQRHVLSSFHRLTVLLAVVVGALWVASLTHTMCWSARMPTVSIEAVPVVYNGSVESVLAHRARGLPALFPGVVGDLLDEMDWTASALLHDCPPQFEMDAQFGMPEHEPTVRRHLERDEFLAALMARVNETWSTPDDYYERVARKRPYLTESAIPIVSATRQSALDRLLNRLALPQHGGLHRTGHTSFWIGTQGQRTGLHLDWIPMNILHQMHGTKIVHLYPPSDIPKLSLDGKFDTSASASRVNPFDTHSDSPVHRLLRSARPLVVTLQPGDALFIPPLWAHSVHSAPPDVDNGNSDAAPSSVVSISAISYSSCEILSWWFQLVRIAVHSIGWYRYNDCTCHTTEL